jgi:ribosomal protein L17
MRHRMTTTTFGRSGAHRQALLACLVCNLIFE